MEEEFEEEGASPRPEEGGGASEEEEDEVEGEDNVSVFEMETSEDEERLPRGRPKTGNKKTPSGRPRGRPAGSRAQSSVLSPKEERQRSQCR